VTRTGNSPGAASAADPVQMMKDQRSFLILVAVVAAMRFLLPPGRVPDAQETW